MTQSSKYPVRNHPHPPSKTSKTGGSWHTSIHARELRFGTQVKNHISWCSMMSKITPSSKYPVRNLQHPPSMISRKGGSWHIYIHARELKFGTQDIHRISWWSMMSRRTPTSKYPVRNHQRPPSTTLRTGGYWHTFIHAKELKFGTQVKSHISWWSMMSRMTLSSKYLVRNHQHPPCMDLEDGRFLTH